MMRRGSAKTDIVLMSVAMTSPFRVEQVRPGARHGIRGRGLETRGRLLRQRPS